MKAIMIVIFMAWGSGRAGIESVEFDSIKACESAAQQLAESFTNRKKSRSIHAICVEKG